MVKKALVMAGLGLVALYLWEKYRWDSIVDTFDGGDISGGGDGGFDISAYLNSKAAAANEWAFKTVGVRVADMQTISLSGLAFIKGWEKFRANSYYATEYEKARGIKTIGYGHVIRKGESFNEPMTQAEADALLLKDLAEFEGYVRAYVKVPLTQGQYDALVSLMFNVGPGNFRASSVYTSLKAGDYAAAADWFLEKGLISQKGVVLRGLVDRRERERAMFLKKQGVSV